MSGLDLHRASVYFDRDPIYDLAGDKLWNAQVASFEGSLPDGRFQQRRTISMAPGLTVPTERTVSVYGQLWLLGDPIPDGWGGKPVRQNCSTRLVTDEFKWRTPGDLADGDNEVTTYGQKLFYRNSYDKKTTSETDPEFQIFLPKDSKPVVGDTLISDNGSFFVNEVSFEVEGFWMAYASRLRNPLVGTDDYVVEATLQGSFDPVTEAWTKGATIDVVMLRRYLLYFNMGEAARDNLAGDLSLLLNSDTTAPTTSDKLEIENQMFQVESVLPYRDAHLIHIRQV